MTIYRALLSFLLITPMAQGTIYLISGAGCPSSFEMFNINDPYRNMDHGAEVMYNLRAAFNKLGYTVEVEPASSKKNLTDVEALIYLDMPNYNEIQNQIQKCPYEKRIAILWEPPAVWQRNYDPSLQAHFGKICTLFDDLIDNKKFFKLYEPQPISKFIENTPSFKERKLCCILTGYHLSRHKNELYTHRYGIIDFFEKNDPANFDFYGTTHCYPSHFQKYKTHKGSAPSKIDCLQNYRFNICYENTYGIKGYLTGSKLFYPLITGCIPVYWGDPNITDTIPADCFIDRRNFSSNKKLYKFLKNMTEETYNGYVERIKKFLETPAAALYSQEHFIHIVLSTVDSHYDKEKAFTPEQLAVIRKLYPN